MNITIKKSEVYGEVEKIAGYSAKFEATKIDSAENTYRRQAVFEPYRTLLDDVFDRGCNHLTESLSNVTTNYAGGVTEDDDKAFCLIVTMPYNWNDALESEVVATAKAYLVSHVASMWMRIIENEDEDKYYTDSQKHLLEFARLLHRKKRVGRAEFKRIMEERRANAYNPYRCDHTTENNDIEQ